MEIQHKHRDVSTSRAAAIVVGSQSHPTMQCTLFPALTGSRAQTHERSRNTGTHTRASAYTAVAYDFHPIFIRTHDVETPVHVDSLLACGLVSLEQASPIDSTTASCKPTAQCFGNLHAASGPSLLFLAHLRFLFQLVWRHESLPRGHLQQAETAPNIHSKVTGHLSRRKRRRELVNPSKPPPLSLPLSLRRKERACL